MTIDQFVVDNRVVEFEKLERVLFSILNLPLATKHAVSLAYKAVPDAVPVSVVAARVISKRTLAPVSVHVWRDCRTSSPSELLAAMALIPSSALIVAAYATQVLAGAEAGKRSDVRALIRSDRYIVFIDTEDSHAAFAGRQNAREIQLVNMSTVSVGPP